MSTISPWMIRLEDHRLELVPSHGEVEVQGHGRSKARLPWGYSINGHATGTDLLEVPIPYIRPMFQAYVREYPNKIWPKIWY